MPAIPTHSAAGEPRSPSRRAVLTTAAWSAPVVALAASAPAHASGSACPEGGYAYAYAYTGWTRTVTTTTSTKASGNATSVNGGPDVLISAVASALGSGVTFGATGLPGNVAVVKSVVNIVDGATSSEARPQLDTLGLGMNAPNMKSGQQVVFTFARPVTNLRFAIGDIDTDVNTPANGYFRDAVSLSSGFTWTTGYGPTVPTGATLPTTAWPGDGTLGNGWRIRDTGDGDYLTTGRREVRVTYPGPLTTFTLTYINQISDNSPIGNDQAVFVSPLYFDVPC
ncbi:hypothetical protein [Serinibacter salmoneus]|uniref:Alternate signal-mediated exported protein n=1 Tax=Serinibacter salmoneus TaxID=556530 RepID=A0A2A9D2V6_9MICO|nr:hypothetical protein [Serinibacter salmoneus]PFG21037.1 hypothetical protein ATL40_2656 [Serinibacter salmoneus]